MSTLFLASRWIAATLSLLVAGSPAAARAGYATGTACGVERWAIKTAMDPQASSLPTLPVDTNVSALAAVAPPAIDLLDAPSRIAPIETTLFAVRALLVGVKLEEDSDEHMLLRDPQTGQEMNAEIPASFCTSSPLRAAFAAARRELGRIVAAAGAPPVGPRFSWLDRNVPPMVYVEGYGFFDEPHSRGAARNGIELHPVIAIRAL